MIYKRRGTLRCLFFCFYEEYTDYMQDFWILWRIPYNIQSCMRRIPIMNHDELYKALCKVPSGKEKSRDRIIIELYMRSQGASQKQLVDALNMRPATVSEQTDILIQLGYVTKHIDFMDKRISVVGLTDEGKRLGKSLLHSYDQFLNVLFSDLSEEEQEELYRLLGKLKRPILRK